MAKKDRKKLDPILTGVAGAYYVAAELSRRGIVATMTLRNTPGVDILASDTLKSGQRALVLSQE